VFGRARNDPFEHRIAPAVHMARCQLFTRPNMALHEHPCARVLFALHAPFIHTGEVRAATFRPPPDRRVHLCFRARVI